MNNKLLLIALFTCNICFANEVICSPNDCYNVEKVLGQGAFGKVYQVTNSMGEKFALKSYLSNHSQNQTSLMLADAQREFSIGQKLDHPNILKSIETFADSEDTHYVLFEFVDGVILHQINRNELSKSQSTDLAFQLTQAFKYAFQKGYLYIDLHGSNLMVTEELQTKMIDVSSFFTFEELKKLFHQTSKNLNPSPREKKILDYMKKRPHIFANRKVSRDLTTDNYIKYFEIAKFDDVTKAITMIISKANLDKETKIELYSRIKKISWSYFEDFYDDKAEPFEFYFQQVEDILLEN